MAEGGMTNYEGVGYMQWVYRELQLGAFTLPRYYTMGAASGPSILFSLLRVLHFAPRALPSAPSTKL